jgi:hypothetical protein
MPEGRDLKTDQSAREIPLVGVALRAMQEQPDGFPRYRDKADVLSALVNKALKARELRPERGQSLYSLRHTFEDRLTAVDAPDKIIACLMGHKWSRPRYGVGPSLEHKRDWLERIACQTARNVDPRSASNFDPSRSRALQSLRPVFAEVSAARRAAGHGCVDEC